ncbi:MAG: class I SAM-dependent methyltransferase [Planctomycetes bacterium]|nr:class I SAM-dependent methyltransferase [Planctomycetota bacterium]
MSRSYQADDRVFQKLRAAGKTSWDEQADPHATFDRFVMRPFLEESLAALTKPLHGLSALEIGCGSGPIACFLAAHGLEVRGIDVAPTALEMARQHAAARGLTVRFDAADICLLPEQPDRYDLIIDGHCLHCIVQDDHRSGALGSIHRLLKPGGLFLIETMIAHEGLVVAGNYRIDAEGVLSIKVEGPGIDGAFMVGDEWFAPYRRLRTAAQMAAELADAGFVVQFQRVTSQADARKPMLMQIRAGALSA